MDYLHGFANGLFLAGLFIIVAALCGAVAFFVVNVWLGR